MKLHTLEKATRIEALSMVRKLQRTSGLSDIESSKLYNLLSERPAAPTGTWDFVAAAAAPIEEQGHRLDQRLVFVKKGIAFACDGNRLHWGKTYREDGAYAPDGIEWHEKLSSQALAIKDQFAPTEKFTRIKINSLSIRTSPRGEVLTRVRGVEVRYNDLIQAAAGAHEIEVAASDDRALHIRNSRFSDCEYSSEFVFAMLPAAC